MQQIAIGDLPLASGQILRNPHIAYETYGKLNADASNAILVTHGLTSGVDMLAPSTISGEGSWADLLCPGRALDAERYFVVCSNVIGSSLGSTGPASQRPEVNRHWGPDFPVLTMSDIVAAQRVMLAMLGVHQLRCVLGPSFGGIQALQWALDQPDMVDTIGVIVAGLTWPDTLSSSELRQRLATDPAWAGGWYQPGKDLLSTMTTLRHDTLISYGMRSVIQKRWPDNPERVAQALQVAAETWALRFDANALLTLQAAGEKFDANSRIEDIQCPVLFVSSKTDQIFPPSSKQSARLAHVKGPLIYRELETDLGHSASGIELHQWETDLQKLLSLTTQAHTE